MWRRRARRDGVFVEESRIVWLMCAPRSGSTWLLNLICAHPGFVKLDEPLIGAHLGLRTSSVTSGRGTGPSDLNLRESQAARPSYFFSDEHADAWRPALRALIHRRVASEVAARGGTDRSYVVIKEPHGSEAAPMLMETLPRSKLIFLARDVRDVVDSVLDMTRSQGRSQASSPDGDDPILLAGSIARDWEWRNRQVRTAFEALPADQRLFVRYEDLIAATMEHLVRILDWLGVAADRRQTREIVERLAFDRIPEEQRGAGRFHRAATPGLWRQNLRPEQEASVLAAAGDLQGELESWGR